MSEQSGEYMRDTMADRVKLCAELTGTARELARMTEIPRRTLGTYMSGQAALTVDRAARIAEVSGVSLRWLVSGQGSMRGHQRLIPITGTTETGPTAVAMGAECVPVESCDKDAYALRVTGGRMAPRCLDGEVLLLHPNARPTAGEEALVRTTDGRVMVRTLVSLMPDRVVVAAMGDQYDQEEIPLARVQMLHPVAAIYRRSTIRGATPD